MKKKKSKLVSVEHAFLSQEAINETLWFLISHSPALIFRSRH